ncbi:CamS family sex pheromone protein [Bacillus sp. S2(2024)]|uniref:CamS family sex pheromone protein n=2 Tax=Bacillus sp. S2(2024) TaxID=3162887 RepID=UPI003D1D1793
MKQIVLFIISLILILTGCSMRTNKEDQIIKKDGNTKKEKSIIPKYSISNEYYQMVIPLKEQKIVGTINEKTNSKLNVDEFETGLMNIALKQFDTKKYYFQRSEYLSLKALEKIITGQETPYVSNIIEHDYFTKKDNNRLELGGIVVGLAMTSNYSNEEILNKGNEIANELLKELYKSDVTQTVPITFAIFKQESKTSLKAGTIISSSIVAKGDQKVGEWSTVNEQSFVYPSEELTKMHDKDVELLDEFSKQIKDTAKDQNFSVGVSAKLNYKENKLEKLNISLNIEINDRSEAIKWTEVVTDKAVNLFKNNKSTKIQLTIKSAQKNEAVVILNKNGDKPFVYFMD